jgi:hypothetical protein
MDIKKKWNSLSVPAKLGCAGGGALFVIIGLAGGFDDPPESTTPAGVSETKPTPQEKLEDKVEEKPVQYTIIRETNNRAELVLEDPNEDNARKAIKRYVDDVLNSDSDQPEYSIMILGDDADKTYICKGRWVRDEKSAAIYTGGTVKADKWPHVEYNCPNPKGY